MASAFDATFRALPNYCRASGFSQESSTTAAEASSAEKVEVRESWRAGPKGEEKALEALEGLFEKSHMPFPLPLRI